MHTDLSFLEPGAPWPPRCDEERLARYALNRARFEGRYRESRNEGYLNYFRLVTLKLTDLIGKPSVSAGLSRAETAAGPEREDAVWDVVHESGIETLAVKAVYDMSRYGDAILRVGRGKNGQSRVSLARPDVWFPVVDARDVGCFQAHVLAWVSPGEPEDGTNPLTDAAAAEGGIDGYISENAKGPIRRMRALFAHRTETRRASSGGLARGAKKLTLTCEIHTPGFVEKRRYAMKNGRISALLCNETAQTGLRDFAIIPVQNCVTSDRAFGQDDYSQIGVIASELETRFEQIAKVLDKHTEPSMQGPACALSRGEDGEYRLKTGEYFVNQEDGDERAGQISYLTWDAKLDANFSFVEKLTNQLYALSEMGGALMGDIEGRFGNIPSGSALRRLLLSPLNKAARVRAELDAKLKKAIVLCCAQDGVDLSDAFVTIRWADALPADKLELAEIVSKRTGGAKTLSAVSAIKALDGVDGEEAEAEVGRILKELRIES